VYKRQVGESIRARIEAFAGLPADLGLIEAGPKEERVLSVERGLRELATLGKKDKLSGEFLAGYLTSLIAPGTFDHRHVLEPFLETLPSANLWYGLCAGLHSNSKLRSFGEGIGRRILRDAMYRESYLDRPRGDIALPELEVLASANGGLAVNVTRDTAHLAVEVAPCVNVTMRSGEHRPPDSLRVGKQNELFPQDYQTSDEIRLLLQDLKNSLNKASDIERRIERAIAADSESGAGGRKRTKKRRQ